MSERVAVITGCSSGFGLLSTIELARKGYRVAASVLDLAQRGALDKAAASAGVTDRIKVSRLDVTETATHAAFVDGVLQQFGRIDVLVNNAGFALSGFCEDVTLEELHRQFETNFFGHVSLTKAVLPAMRRQGSGRILMVSSMAGRSPMPGLSSYASSKFALEGYTEALRMEMAPLNIVPVLIEPGNFATDVWNHPENLAASAFDKASPNLERTHRFHRFAQSGVKLSDPKRVALLIADLADRPNPRLRYIIGKDAKILIYSRALLPFRIFEKQMVKKMGIVE
jgi:NAD(P)-dependent dehydrogenase (short-subunit alcohol dehydrogenase family)